MQTYAREDKRLAISKIWPPASAFAIAKTMRATWSSGSAGLLKDKKRFAPRPCLGNTRRSYSPFGGKQDLGRYVRF